VVTFRVGWGGELEERGLGWLGPRSGSRGYDWFATPVTGFVDVDPAGLPRMYTTTDNASIRARGGMATGDTMDICIISGGVPWLSVLQVIMRTPRYKSGQWKPTLFEARDKPSGIW